MNPVAILQILQGVLQLAQTGSELASFLESVSTRIKTDQAAGVDISAADWSFLDAAAAANVAQAEQFAGQPTASTAS